MVRSGIAASSHGLPNTSAAAPVASMRREVVGVIVCRYDLPTPHSAALNNAVERDQMEYDMVVVGASPSGFACAICMKQGKRLAK